jgi:predicted porin
MKKHLLALAALATVSGAAFAQSVTVYGILDTSYTNVPKNTTAGTQSAITSSVWLPSVFGFTGTEDLGGGMKAGFELESDINTDAGTQGAGGIFGRKSTVSLSGNFGKVSAGNMIDIIFLQGFIDNVRQAHSSSSAVLGLAYGESSGTGATTAGNVFTPNSIKYTSPTIGGLTATVQRQLGEAVGDTGKSSATAGLLNYTQGALSLSAAYKESSNTNDVTVQKKTYFGATYKVGQFGLSGTYTKYKGDGTVSTKDAQLYEAGVSYAISPSLTAAVNYVSIDDKATDKRPTVSSVSLKQSLSKRTSLWALASQVDNKGGTNAFSPFYNTVQAAGTKATGVAVGVTHTF